MRVAPRSFAPKAPEIWWRTLMPPGSPTAALIREIETVRAVATAADARMSAHEQVCAERYKRIEEKLETIPGEHTNIRLAIAGLEGAIKKISEGTQQTAWKANWKAWTFAGGAFVALLGLLGRVSYLLYVAPLLAAGHIAGH